MNDFFYTSEKQWEGGHYIINITLGYCSRRASLCLQRVIPSVEIMICSYIDFPTGFMYLSAKV